MPLVGSQCCPARVNDKTFQSFGDKTTLSKSFGFPFSQSNVGTFKQVPTSFGLSKRRISADFSCFDQSLILPAASIQRSQTLLLLFRMVKILPGYSTVKKYKKEIFNLGSAHWYTSMFPDLVIKAKGSIHLNWKYWPRRLMAGAEQLDFIWCYFPNQGWLYFIQCCFQTKSSQKVVHYCFDFES